MDLDKLLQDQGGVVTYEQALAAGVSSRQLRPGGRLLRVRQGVYAERSRVEAADKHTQTILHIAAARITTDVDLVAAGRTAALAHRLPILGTPRGVDLVERKDLRPRHHGSSTTIGSHDVVQVMGAPVTSLARTAVDVARRHGFAAGVVTADAVLARDVTRAELMATVDACRRWSGSRIARRVMQFADPLSETALESLGRARFEEHGLPPCELQVVLGDDDGPIGRVDHYWAAHRTVAEGDGALKYTTGADLFAEKRREDRLREAGFEVVRYTWDEVLRTPEVVVARILAAFARAAARRAA
jgi:predicted transcriptional regulator of viral defense system